MSDEPEGTGSVVTQPVRPTGKRSRRGTAADDADTARPTPRKPPALEDDSQEQEEDQEGAPRGRVRNPIAFVINYLARSSPSCARSSGRTASRWSPTPSVVLVFLAFMVTLIGLVDLGVGQAGDDGVRLTESEVIERTDNVTSFDGDTACGCVRRDRRSRGPGDRDRRRGRRVSRRDHRGRGRRGRAARRRAPTAAAEDATRRCRGRRRSLLRPPTEAEDEEEDPAVALKKELRLKPGEWYVIHSYAGYENKVKANLETRVQNLDVGDYIFQVEVPTEEVTEIKNGQRKQVNRKVLPGYILVRMELNDESWGAVRNTPA